MSRSDSRIDLHKFTPSHDDVRRLADEEEAQARLRRALDNPALDDALTTLVTSPDDAPGAKVDRVPPAKAKETRTRKATPWWLIVGVVLAVGLPVAITLVMSARSTDRKIAEAMASARAAGAGAVPSATAATSAMTTTTATTSAKVEASGAASVTATPAPAPGTASHPAAPKMPPRPKATNENPYTNVPVPTAAPVPTDVTPAPISSSSRWF